MVADPSREGASFAYTHYRERKINSNNSWAIQLLVGRNENSVGFSDYTAGFDPDFELEEDLANLGILGDLNEPLLAKAIDEILGVSSKRDFTVKIPVRLFSSSGMMKPLKDNMVLDKEFYLPLLD